MTNKVAGGQAIAGFLLVGMICGGAQGATPTRNSRESVLTVRVFNYFGAAAADLDRAQRRAQRILDEAGVQTRWFDCTADKLGFAKEPICQIAVGPLDLELKVVANSRIPRSVLSAIGFGMAQYPEEGFALRASILYQKARELATVTGYSPDLILGQVIAHELTHLLLGEGSHSTEGLMRARWDERDLQLASRGHLGLTPKQAKRVRSAVDSRRTAFD